jgi:exonuclease III
LLYLLLGNHDTMGLAIMTHESHCVRTLKIHTFDDAARGYKLDNILTIPMWWFSSTYLRPGYMITLYDHDTLLVNVHLVTGNNNMARLKQVACLLDDITVHVANNHATIKHIIIAGDFNADETDPSIITMKNNYTSIIRNATYAHSQLDYIFVNEAGLYKSHIWFDGTNGPLVSDHYGIYSHRVE